jgi:hypothetical protein
MTARTRMDLYRIRLLDLALLASGLRRHALPTGQRAGLNAALQRALDVLQQGEPMPPTSAEQARLELASALAACGAMGVPWADVVALVNEQGERPRPLVEQV